MSYSTPKYEEEFVSDRALSSGPIQQTPEQYHPLLNVSVPKGVEYISVDDPAISTGWGDTLIHHTGTAFLCGKIAVYNWTSYIFSQLH